MTGRRCSGAVSGTENWSVSVEPRGDREWSWQVYPPSRLAYIGGAQARYGEAWTRRGAIWKSRRALSQEKALLARRARRAAAAITEAHS